MDTLYYYPGACSLSVARGARGDHHLDEAKRIDIHGGENDTPEFARCTRAGWCRCSRRDGVLTEAPTILLHLRSVTPRRSAAAARDHRAHALSSSGCCSATHPHPAFSRVMRPEHVRRAGIGRTGAHARRTDFHDAPARRRPPARRPRLGARRALLGRGPAVPDDLLPVGPLHRTPGRRAARPAPRTSSAPPRDRRFSARSPPRSCRSSVLPDARPSAPVRRARTGRDPSARRSLQGRRVGGASAVRRRAAATRARLTTSRRRAAGRARGSTPSGPGRRLPVGLGDRVRREEAPLRRTRHELARARHVDHAIDHDVRDVDALRSEAAPSTARARAGQASLAGRKRREGGAAAVTTPSRP